MSIINDALKKVQQGLTPPQEETSAPMSGTTSKGDTYIYSTPSQNSPNASQDRSEQKLAFQNKVKSICAVIGATLITAASAWYIYQQFQQDIPKVQTIAKRSFYQLIHKEPLPDFKTKLPQDLDSLAQITIPSTTANTQLTAPVTLNVHGIMANASGNLALINDQVYQEGDEIDGAKILKINLDSITISINGTEKTIYVKS